jgi:ABC-2 type transport system permease protein/fluoroquinolone transport system permease protein
MSLLRQDVLIVMRSRFPHVTLIVALLLILLIHWVLPAEIQQTVDPVYLDMTPDSALTGYLLSMGVSSDQILTDPLVWQSEVVQRQSFGIKVEGELTDPTVTILHQGTESEKTLKVMDTQITALIRNANGIPASDRYRIVSLRPSATAVPFNLSFIPLVLVFDVVLLGFMFVAVMVFQEKQEGSIQAYRVSPGGVMEYIWSKAVVMILLGILYTVVLLAFTMGIRVPWVQVILLMIVTSLLMTFFGLFISVYFSNLSEFLFVSVAVSALFTLPIVSYMTPSFAPAYLTWIPAYPALFGLRELLFPTGKTGFLIPIYRVLLVEAVILMMAAYWSVQKKLMKGGQ